MSDTRSTDTERDEAGLDATQRDRLKQALITMRASLFARHEGQIRDAVGDAPEVGDEMDAASHSDAQATLLGLAAAERERLTAIDAALAKFDNGTYGLCEESGEPIGYPRLAAVPWARHTVAYEEQLEREAHSRRG